MKVCIYGAGAIGGHVGAVLAMQDVDVTLIARGPHLAAIRAGGLRLLSGGEEHVVKPRATDDPAEAGEQDYVLLAVKAPAVPAIVDAMQPLLGPRTTVVTMQNGIPFWYFHRAGGALDGRRLHSVDPGGRQWSGIGPERAIGCVVWTAGEVVEPGVVRHDYGNRMVLGEPDGERSERALRLSEAMLKGGLKSPVRPRIRNEIWAKLWGNLSFNPVSALTHGTLEQMATDPGIRQVVRAMMVEAQAVAEALGVVLPMDVDARIKAAEEVGAHRTSMLQDLVLGRSMEIDALVTAVVEIAALVAVPVPTIELVLALLTQRAEVAGCYTRPAPPAGGG